MLSKATLKLIRALDSRKGRRSEGLFVAEGPKLVRELMGYFELRQLIISSDALQLCRDWLSSAAASRIVEVTADELSRASLQQTPQGVIALFEIPDDEADFAAVASSSLTLLLDDVQDPGNLGTIVRLADWFGISHIFATPATADVYNPKAVQASMGGLARTRVHILNDVPSALAALPPSVPVYATSLHGEVIWNSQLSSTGVIVMGNEGRGISPAVEAKCSRRLLIPTFPSTRTATDSLNVAMATGIVLAEFRRRLS